MNLLEETRDILSENGKTIFDIEWFGTDKERFDCDLKQLLDINYDNGYGAEQIPLDFILVGKGFWLERCEYDGSEWWEFKHKPRKPKQVKSIKKLLT